ncbi:GNAT family N-acetyltransferase [Flavobacteriaceae bacterium]|nr:GNAT family N-acetyltransferase [Flavobacteriaceae bacterium]
MEIKELKISTTSVITELQKLIEQLSTKGHIITKKKLNKIIHDESTQLFVANETGGKIIGTLTLVSYQIPTGLKFWIEDVVVDSDFRGRGVGQKLTEMAMEYAEKKGCKSINLTSNPKRKAAHQLYIKMGFKQRETDVFRYEIQSKNNSNNTEK